MDIIQVDNLTKKYGIGESEVIALDHVSFTVEEGEFVAIIGPSGCGKSTLLHLLGAVDNPSEGYVKINHKNISEMNMSQAAVFRRKHIGLIYQFYNLIPVLNVKENIELPLKLDSKKTNDEELKRITDLLNLKDRINHLPSQLSGGQQQRVAIARAIITKPDVILADEPTGNLDKKNGDEVISYIKHLHEKNNQTIIMVTHDLQIAKQAQRIITMEDGRILKDEKTS